MYEIIILNLISNKNFKEKYDSPYLLKNRLYQLKFKKSLKLLEIRNFI